MHEASSREIVTGYPYRFSPEHRNTNLAFFCQLRQSPGIKAVFIPTAPATLIRPQKRHWIATKATSIVRTFVALSFNTFENR
jgi:hypothetical protein